MRKLTIISTLSTASWAGCEELWFSLLEAMPKGSVHVILTRRPPPEKLHALKELGATVSWLRFGRFFHLMSKLPCLSGCLTCYFKWLLMRNPAGHYLVSLSWEHDGHVWFRALSGKAYSALFQNAAQREWPTDARRAEGAKLLSRAHNLFVVSDTNARVVREHYGLWNSNFVKVLNPPHTSLLDIPFSWPTSKPNLAVVGRLNFHQKGHDVLLRSYSQVKPPFALRFYGDGENREALLDLIQHYGLQESCSWEGYCKPLDIWHENHGLFLPSRHEGAAIVNYEAMLSGRPIFTTAINREDLTPEFSCVEEGCNDAAVTRLLERAAQTMPAWEDMGRKAYQHGRSLFESPAGKQLLDLLF